VDDPEVTRWLRICLLIFANRGCVRDLPNAERVRYHRIEISDKIPFVPVFATFILSVALTTPKKITTTSVMNTVRVSCTPFQSNLSVFRTAHLFRPRVRFAHHSAEKPGRKTPDSSQSSTARRRRTARFARGCVRHLGRLQPTPADRQEAS